jgi:hypothetical protein
MAREPVCCLCQGKLVKEARVTIGFQHWMALAWVCKDCGAAFPIAVRPKLFGSTQQVYQDGKRFDEA